MYILRRTFGMQPAEQPSVDEFIGTPPNPSRHAIGSFEITAFWNDWGFDPPVIESKLWVGRVSYDAKAAVRIFPDRTEFAAFIQGLRDGKWPVPLGPEHNVYSLGLCQVGDDTWADREKRQEVAELFGWKLPEDHENRTDWEEL